MAHTCPDCGCTCHCHDDIDDMVLDNDEDISCCTHCVEQDDDEVNPYLLSGDELKRAEDAAKRGA